MNIKDIVYSVFNVIKSRIIFYWELDPKGFIFICIMIGLIFSLGIIFSALIGQAYSTLLVKGRAETRRVLRAFMYD